MWRSLAPQRNVRKDLGEGFARLLVVDFGIVHIFIFLCEC